MVEIQLERFDHNGEGRWKLSILIEGVWHSWTHKEGKSNQMATCKLDQWSRSNQIEEVRMSQVDEKLGVC